MRLFIGAVVLIVLAASFANGQPRETDLTVTITVIGKAKVAADIGGAKAVVVDCTQSATDCTKTFSFPRNSSVTITGTAIPGFFFNGWVNRSNDVSACSDLNPTCKFTLTQNTTIGAFYGVPLALSFKSGAGGERIVVNSPNSGFDMSCAFNKSCTEIARSGIQIVMKAQSGVSTFTGWTGGAGSATVCNGLKTDCSFTLNQGSAVQAGFTPNPKLLISRTGDGQFRIQGGSFDKTIGSIAFNVTEISNGVPTTVTALPASGVVFKRWVDGTGPAIICKDKTNPVCSFALIGNASLKAEFGQ